jgi:hypothetical protein
MTEAVNTLVYTNYSEKSYADILKLIPRVGTKGISKQSLSQKTRHLGKRKRDELITELMETGEITGDIRVKDDRRTFYYWRIK